MLLSVKLWRCIKCHSTPAFMSYLTGGDLSLEQVQSVNLSMFTSFYYNCEHCLKQPKMLTCQTAVECQKIRCINQHKFASKSSLTGLGMSLDQVKYTYACLPAFIMTDNTGWSRQKYCPATLLLSAKLLEDASTNTRLLQISLPWLVGRNEFGSCKIYLSVHTSFYYDWTTAEAATNPALPLCW